MKKITYSICATILLSLIHSGQAQVSISGDLPQNYTQNFDSLGTTSVNWTNNLTLPGWVFNIGLNGTNDFPIFTLVTNNGSVTTPFSFHFGDDGSTERALGSIAGPNFVFLLDHYYGAQFVNNSSNTITQVDMSYTGEQWRDSTNLSQSLQFFYRVGGGTNFVADPANIGWTPVPAFNFISPKNSGVGQLDGNDPANQKTIQNSISGLNIPAGESFWIRWFDVDDGSINIEDHALAIDNVSVSFSSPLPGVTLDLKKPKKDKKLTIPKKGFSLKGYVSSETHPITQASYVAFGGTNPPTNLVFTVAGKSKPAKGKLAKNGVDFIFQSTKAGIGITAGPVTLLIKIEGSVSNIPASAFFTNVFTDVKVK